MTEFPSLEALDAAQKDCQCVPGVDPQAVCPQCQHKPTCDQLAAWVAEHPLGMRKRAHQLKEKPVATDKVLWSKILTPPVWINPDTLDVQQRVYSEEDSHTQLLFEVRALHDGGVLLLLEEHFLTREQALALAESIREVLET